MSDSEWLTTKEVANSFGVRPNTVRRWLLDGKLEKVSTILTPGGHCRYRAVDINRILEEHEDKSTGD